MGSIATTAEKILRRSVHSSQYCAWLPYAQVIS